MEKINPADLQSVGYTYDEATDKWNISDAAADYIFTGHQLLNFALPGTLKVIVYPALWEKVTDKNKYYPIFEAKEFLSHWHNHNDSGKINFVMLDANDYGSLLTDICIHLNNEEFPASSVVLCLSSKNENAMQSVRRMFIELMNRDIKKPGCIDY